MVSTILDKTEIFCENSLSKIADFTNHLNKQAKNSYSIKFVIIVKY